MLFFAVWGRFFGYLTHGTDQKVPYKAQGIFFFGAKNRTSRGISKAKTPTMAATGPAGGTALLAQG
jgi:hypothetical protein